MKLIFLMIFHNFYTFLHILLRNYFKLLCLSISVFDSSPWYFIQHSMGVGFNSVNAASALRELNATPMSCEQNIIGNSCQFQNNCKINFVIVYLIRWRVFLTNILIGPDRAESCVLAACAMHNMLRTKMPSYTNTLLDIESPETHEVIPGVWRNESTLQSIDALHGNTSLQCAKRQRNQLCEFVNGVGAVPWQDRMVQD